ncbi:NAD-dependent epimerase/dehydratase family protein [Actinotalea ferrariae]|uniref:NAD-dependent epimerase/dehydratase family protein n=1 Tax=Actinotalea ferrariae TaxID=1386098 RepID=UPI001C8BC85A|nr:NAD-dependent epimerase/dehydratase family protein [Actinotalea ferrariae]MBX9245746.1 NAD-dependent epimerase/dehydratase family protein [Actinotalea ferrariae]
MRVAVVGASGNIGTALLRALRDEDAVRSVVSVARRVPSTVPPAPYDVAEWRAVDLAAAGPDEPVVAALADAFAGADAVVHLAWAMQPSHDRALLRATNVTGAARVIEAVARAGVPHLVVASSVGAYAPVHDDEPRTEDWATEEVRSSHYSVDKVAVERLLDEAEVLHPQLRVARVRPALVFQRAAGSGIERYFLGPLAPAAALGAGLPVLPWPRGVRVQAVHADDLAQALRAILLDQHVGAFNIAADDVLRAPQVAALLSGGRHVEVPVPLVRAAVHGAWLARAIHISPGWVDLAAGIALMSTERARTVLGWRPRHTAVEALAAVLGGMVDGVGTASPPMRPRARGGRSLVGGQRDVR